MTQQYCQELLMLLANVMSYLELLVVSARNNSFLCLLYYKMLAQLKGTKEVKVMPATRYWTSISWQMVRNQTTPR